MEVTSNIIAAGILRAALVIGVFKYGQTIVLKEPEAKVFWEIAIGFAIMAVSLIVWLIMAFSN